MTFWHNSKIQKALGIGRYFLARIYFGRKLKVGNLSIIGPSNKIVILGKGNIIASGRFILSDHVMLYTKGKLHIGKRFNVNSFSRVVVHNQIDIGDDVTIGQMVSILDHDHKYSLVNGNMILDGYATDPIRIGNNVWIGDKCTILKGVQLGDNVIVGANSVVTGNIPSNVVIAGAPAKIVRNLTQNG